MNQQHLALAAQMLVEQLALAAGKDPLAAGLLEDLAEVLARARSGALTQPLVWRDIPGDRLFDEGSLGEHEGLEAAYSRFKIEATGGDNDVLALLRTLKVRHLP